MKNFLIALKLIVLMTLILGLLYPLAITGIVQAIFPHRANGSILVNNGKVIGSVLIGQKFESDRYFWTRPSAIDYNPMPSGGSNLGPTSAELQRQIESLRSILLKTDSFDERSIIPLDLLFASGSGLDPHISPEAARFQANRIIRSRGFDKNGENELYKLIDKYIEPRDFLILGEPRINVLKLNVALDSLEERVEKNNGK